MKIDYGKDKSMTIKLDKIPRLLYINEEGISCGQVYVNGVRIRPLNQVDIHAKTNEAKVHFLEYSIKYINEKTHEVEIMGMEDPFESFNVKVSLKDTDIFRNLIKLLKTIIANKDVDAIVRKNIMNELNRIMEERV